MNVRIGHEQPRSMEALRLPPHSIDAEQAVLGALMLSGKALSQISDWLSESDFYRSTHRMIYRAITELAAASKPYDAVTLSEWADVNGGAELLGGRGYCLQIANTTGSAANVAAYAEIVREKSRLRLLIDESASIASAAWSPRADASLIASNATTKLGALIGGARAGGLVELGSGIGKWWEELNGRYSRNEELTGLETPWRDLNDATLGFQAGDLIIVAGRPSMGKSILGFECAAFAGLRGKNVAVFSLEMRENQFIQRSVSALAQVPYRALQLPRGLSELQWESVAVAMGRLKESSIHFDAQPRLTAQQIVARAKRQHMRRKLDFIVVDHLHEMKRPGRDLQNEIADDVRTLRGLAKDLGVPLMLLSQLSRGLSTRSSHRPEMSDIRGSGGGEEAADMVCLIHREDYYSKTTHLKGVVEIILAKARDMETRSIYLENHFAEMRMSNWDGPLPSAPSKADEKKEKLGTGKKKTEPAQPFNGAN